ncbi:MAG: hypothetical protein AB2448_01725 [Moorella sp. (in: firmicutes)]
MTEAIKVTVEKGSRTNKQKIMAFCDTDCFVKGACTLEWGRCEYGEAICCVLCGYALDCDGCCERIQKQ